MADERTTDDEHALLELYRAVAPESQQLFRDLAYFLHPLRPPALVTSVRAVCLDEEPEEAPLLPSLLQVLAGGKDLPVTWESLARRYALHLDTFEERTCLVYCVCPFCLFRAERRREPGLEISALVRNDMITHLQTHHEAELAARLATRFAELVARFPPKE